MIPHPLRAPFKNGKPVGQPLRPCVSLVLRESPSKTTRHIKRPSLTFPPAGGLAEPSREALRRCQAASSQRAARQQPGRKQPGRKQAAGSQRAGRKHAGSSQAASSQAGSSQAGSRQEAARQQPASRQPASRQAAAV